MKARLRIGRAARCRAYTRDAKSGSGGGRTDEPIDDLRRDALLAKARLPQGLTATFLCGRAGLVCLAAGRVALRAATN